MSIKKEYSKSHNFVDFSKRYVEYLNNTLKSLNFNKLEKISKEFELVKRKNKLDVINFLTNESVLSKPTLKLGAKFFII